MTTTYENMVLNEAHRREHKSKAEWGRQHAGDILPMAYPMDSLEFARLEKLKSKVADLVDLQPTPASMVRPPRKVRAHSARRAPPTPFALLDQFIFPRTQLCTLLPCAALRKRSERSKVS